jgi:hypothetical protein
MHERSMVVGMIIFKDIRAHAKIGGPIMYLSTFTLFGTSAVKASPGFSPPEPRLHGY